MNTRRRASISALLLYLAMTGRAAATIPVVDVSAVRQLLQEVAAWNQQLEGMRLQLAQLQQTRVALTGSRGMDQLMPVPLAARNYLPPDWNGLAGLFAGGGGDASELASATRSQVESSAILAAADVSRLSPALQELLGAERAAVATGQALSRAAYAHSSDRFAALSMLIDKIRATPDAKAIAELQGRIAAEQAMLANEGAKLVALAHLTDAEHMRRDLTRRELVVQGHGTFGMRFQPAPPVP